MHTFSVFLFFFSLNLFCYVFVLFCSVFFSLIFQADTNSILCHLVVEHLISHIFLIIMIIMPCSEMFRNVPGCSGMFRDVPGCSMFPVLSTPNMKAFLWEYRTSVNLTGSSRMLFL